jgi:cell division protein FtsW (lipid II flippase)
VREDERSLLGIVMLLALVNGLSVSLGRTGSLFGTDAVYMAAVMLAFIVVHLAFILTGYRGDQVLMPLCAAITVMGYASVLRLRPDLALRQAGFVWVGCALMFTAATLTSRRLLVGAGMGILGASILFLIITLFSGSVRGGARSWLFLGPLGFQASEFAKIGCVLAAAMVLGSGQGDAPLLDGRAPRLAVWALARIRSHAALFLAWGVTVLLTVAQRDLGTAMVIYISCVATLYIATGDRLAVVASGAAAGLGILGASYLWSHVSVRFAAWLNPWADSAGSGYQSIQAYYSLAAGGVLGTGYGAGVPWTIPAAATDMIFAAIAEETGLAGALGIICAFFMLVGRGYVAAMRSRWAPGLIGAVAASSMLAVQFFVIIGGNLGLLPLTGVTLPFASYGGSSMSTSMALVGILMGCAAARAPQEAARR